MFIYVLTGLARHSCTQGVLDAALSGHVKQASRNAGEMAHAECNDKGLTDVEAATLYADLLLAQARDEEAEEQYRVATKRAAAGPRGLVRILSGRNTGFLCLFQQRYATAAQCFQRVAEDGSATTAHRVEALCGLAIATNGMGLTQRALIMLEEASRLAGAIGGAPLAMLTHLTRVELLVQHDLRSRRSLEDHAFWRAASYGATAGTGMPTAREALAACRSAYGHHALIADRLRYLETLIRSADGDTSAMNSLPQHLVAMHRQGLSACERLGRVDAVLAAVAVGNADIARAMMEPMCDRGSGAATQQRWSFELSYCLAKVCELTGRTAESLMHYHRYALETLHCVRTECRPEVVAHQTQFDAATANDDIAMSLPAKYRRAYRYLIEHLDCPSLTVREIAEHVSVTERALQNVFRKHQGMTPAEVMRRRRVEHIREDLLAERCPGATILEAGARWGIRNRSTLVNSYRRHFDETPGQTLQRQSSNARTL